MVFTGIVQALGRAAFDSSSNRLYVLGPLEFWQRGNATNTTSFPQAGDSIAVDGCCLTLLEEVDARGMATFFIMEESRRLIALAHCARLESATATDIHAAVADSNNWVNLERPCRAGDLLDGHLVQGHIDTRAHIVDVKECADGSRRYWLQVGNNGALEEKVVHKGSIALNGVSLTVAEMRADDSGSGKRCATLIGVALTPYTLQQTNFQFKQSGDCVNVEFDHCRARAPSKLDDAHFMRRAIALGERGKCTAAPNPWAGCVIVDAQGQAIIGEGFHAAAGDSHAEVNAIRQAESGGHTLCGATMYVTLEPCCHYGRTPPCDRLVIEKGVGRVVIALLDPDAKVSGTGLGNLKAAGVECTVGVLAEEAQKSLRAYLRHRTSGAPWVVLKFGMSLDGKIQYGEQPPAWITSEESRRHAHRHLRASSQAIVVGRRTAELDDPQLTVRHLPDGVEDGQFKQPLRVVMVGGGGWPKLGANLRNTCDACTIVCCSNFSQIPSDSALTGGMELLKLPGDPSNPTWPDFSALLSALGERGVLQVLVEGGAIFGSHLFKRGLVNQLAFYTAPVVLGSSAMPWYSGGELSAATSGGWSLESVERVGNNTYSSYIYVANVSPASN